MASTSHFPPTSTEPRFLIILPACWLVGKSQEINIYLWYCHNYPTEDSLGPHPKEAGTKPVRFPNRQNPISPSALQLLGQFSWPGPTFGGWGVHLLATVFMETKPSLYLLYHFPYIAIPFSLTVLASSHPRIFVLLSPSFKAQSNRTITQRQSNAPSSLPMSYH